MIKKLWIGLAALALSALPLSAASATSFSLGTLVPGVSPTTFANQVIGGSFTDFWNFSTAAAGAGAGAASATFDIPGFTNPPSQPHTFDIADLNISLFSGSDGSGSLLATSGTGSSVNLTFTGLLNGDYSLRVTGTGSGVSGGIYAGALSVTAATPLPAAFPLMAMGLAALGFAVTRRRKEAV